MKKTSFILYSLFIIPAVAFAQGICPDGSAPGECVNNFYKFALLISGILAFGAIVYGGVKYTFAAGNPSGQSEGKEWVKGALLGLLLLGGAYLILRTINPELVDLSLAELPGLPAPAPAPAPGPAPAGGLSNTDAHTQLTAAGVEVVASTLEGIQQATINEIIRLKRECGGCGIIVTSATGGSHASGSCSHANGYKADFRLTSGLNNFIESNYSYIGTRSDGARQYQAPGGAVYARESDHWDMKAC